MNSRTDTTGHPDVTEISDFTEGLLPPSRITDLRRHIDACDLCADVLRSLEEIQCLLGTLPGPPQMPADVAGRIDAALATEALLDATPSAGSAPTTVSVSVSPGSCGEDAGSSGEDAGAHVSRETSARTDRPVGRPHGATGPGRKDRRRGRRRTVVMGAVLTAAVLGAGSLFLRSFGTDNAPVTPYAQQTTAADTFSGGNLGNQVADLLAAHQGAQPGPDTQEPRIGTESVPQTPNAVKSADTLLQTSAPVPDCIRGGINGSGDILAAKKGIYDGKDAYLVVLPDAGDSTRVTAYVIDAACIGRDPVSPGTVLWKQSFTRS
ncbi:hypothetical protein ACFC09_09610 [Streptomyces sp. NPDC056161]|uniref:hypothetical protein n=1 Tax=Streptomyces sp. NPDC056161 TaxID=3345732 RepID=UPI0035D75EDD